MKTLGFLGKPNPNANEVIHLTTLGRVIGRSGRSLIITKTENETVMAVRVGMDSEGGEVLRVERDILTKSAHSLVYADEPFLMRINRAYPHLTDMRNVFLMSSELELLKFLGVTRRLFEQRGIPYPE